MQDTGLTRMICKKCKQPMCSGSDGSRSFWACLPCQETVLASTDHGAGQKTLTPTNTHVGPKEGCAWPTEPAIAIPSAGERSFLEVWTEFHPDLELKREYVFNLFRNWRCDFAHVESKVAIEYEGYGHGKDNRYKSDVEKYNALANEDWILFRITKAIFSTELGRERITRMIAAAILRREKQ